MQASADARMKADGRRAGLTENATKLSPLVKSGERHFYRNSLFTRKARIMFDASWRPGVDFASGMTAYYASREAHHRKRADAAYREWQEQVGLTQKYGQLAAKAAAEENLAA